MVVVLVYGFFSFCFDIRIVGVVLNCVGSVCYEIMLCCVFESFEILVIGVLLCLEVFVLFECYFGLV